MLQHQFVSYQERKCVKSNVTFDLALFIGRTFGRRNVPIPWTDANGPWLSTGLWFLALSYAVSFGYKKFSGKTLLRMEHFSGYCLLALTLIHGGHIVWQLTKHHI